MRFIVVIVIVVTIIYWIQCQIFHRKYFKQSVRTKLVLRRVMIRRMSQTMPQNLNYIYQEALSSEH